MVCESNYFGKARPFTDSATTVTPWKEKQASKAEVPPPGQESSYQAAKRPFYQWFWAGTHEHTKTLTPDLRYTVKRHVVAKRAIAVALFPIREEKGDAERSTDIPSKEKTNISDAVASDEGERAPSPKDESKSGERERFETYTLENLLEFSFRMQVRRCRPKLNKPLLKVADQSQEAFRTIPSTTIPKQQRSKRKAPEAAL